MERDPKADSPDLTIETDETVDWHVVIEQARERLDSAESDEARAAIWLEIAEIHERELGTPAEAITAYLEALDADPECKTASTALIQLYLAQGDVQEAVDQLHELCSVETDPMLLSQYYGQLAMLYRDELGDPLSAVDFLGLTLDAQFSHIPAFEAIVEILTDSDALSRLEEEYQAMIERNRELLNSLGGRLRSLQEALGKTIEEAAPMIEDSEMFGLTVTRSQTTPPSGSSDDLFATVPARGPIGLPTPPDDVSSEQALPPLPAIPESDASDEPETVEEPAAPMSEAVAQLWLELETHEQTEEWILASETLGRLLEAATTAKEKVDILFKRGQIIQHKIRDNASAEVFYLEALSHRPTSAKTLDALLEIRIETRDYKRAIQLIDRLVTVETDRAKLAEYHFTAATIYRDELRDVKRAIKHYNLTLDHNPDKLKAFEAIDRLFTQQGSWEELAANYRRMIDRLGGDSRQHELLFMLNKNLGEIYRTRMKRFEPAIAAFEAALHHRPNDAGTREMMCQLLEINADSGPVYLEKAIRQFHQLVTLVPDNYAIYHSLANLYQKLGAVDRAWCVTAVLTGLRTATDEQRDYFAVHRSAELATISQNDGDVWTRCLYPREMNLHLNRIMAELNLVVREMRSESVKNLVKRRQQIALDGRDHLGTVVGRVLYLLAIPEPDAFVSDKVTSVDVPLADATVLRISRSLQQADPKTIAFYLGYHGTFLLPQFNTTLYGDRSFLTNCFYAALRSVLPSQPVPINDEMNQVLVALERLPSKERGRLQSMVSDLMTEDAQVSLQEWLEHVEMAALRAAVLACNDFELAVSLLGDRLSLRYLSRERALTDMAWFATSEAYFELREDLGLMLRD